MAHYKRNNSVAMGEFKRSEELFSLVRSQSLSLDCGQHKSFSVPKNCYNEIVSDDRKLDPRVIVCDHRAFTELPDN